MSSRARLAVILAAGFLVRAVAADADPPPWHQLGFISDEGWWAHNGRNLALFGELVTSSPRDDFNQGLWLSPVFTMLCAASFALLGPSLAALRLVSAAAAVVTAGSLARIAGRVVSPEAAPLAALLYLFSPFVWAFGRVGLVEETMNAFVALTLACWVGGTLPWALLAGLAHAAAFATKSYALVAGIGVAVDGIAGPRAPGEGGAAQRALRLGAYGAGLLLGLSVWFVAIQRPFGAEIAELNLKLSQDNLPSAPLAALRNALELPFERSGAEPGIAPWLLYAPVPALMLALALGATLAMPPRAWLAERALGIAAPQLLAYLALLAPMEHKPDRRYAVLLLPEVLLACWGHARGREATAVARQGEAGARPSWARLLEPLPLAMLAAPPLAVLATHGRNSAVVAGGIAALVLWGAGVAAGPRLLAAARGLVAAPAAATLAIFALVVGREALRTTFTVRDEGRALAAIVKGDAVLGGVADTLLLESRARTYNDMRKGSGGRFNGDLLARGGVSWLLTWTQPERLLMPEDPRVTARASKVRETEVLPDGGGHRATILLWRLPSP